MLNVYSRTRDGETLLSRSFRAKEFACKDGTDPLFVDSELVQVLQAIRDHFGAPVVITSGYRTAAHNRAVGGAVYSQHQYGRAADIRVSGVPVEQLAAETAKMLFSLISGKEEPCSKVYDGELVVRESTKSRIAQLIAFLSVKDRFVILFLSNFRSGHSEQEAAIMEAS